VDTSVGGLLVHEGIVSPRIGVSILTWFSRYILTTEIYSSLIL